MDVKPVCGDVKPVCGVFPHCVASIPKRIYRALFSNQSAIYEQEARIDRLEKKVDSKERTTLDMMRKLETVVLFQTRNEAQNIHTMLSRRIEESKREVLSDFQSRFDAREKEFQAKFDALMAEIQRSGAGRDNASSVGAVFGALSINDQGNSGGQPVVATVQAALGQPRYAQLPEIINPEVDTATASRPRGAKLAARGNCQFCGKSLTLKYIKFHELKKCPAVLRNQS